MVLEIFLDAGALDAFRAAISRCFPGPGRDQGALMGQISCAVELEIVEGTGCEVHEVGDRFRYPEDIGQVCPWLLDSVNSMVRVLQFGGNLPWRYRGTPYEKKIDDAGVTTEYVRCPDPTSAGVVMKITRKKLEEPQEVGWS
jgi:uncharacterized repeat protein (TIGR04076 family)